MPLSARNIAQGGGYSKQRYILAGGHIIIRPINKVIFIDTRTKGTAYQHHGNSKTQVYHSQSQKYQLLHIRLTIYAKNAI